MLSRLFSRSFRVRPRLSSHTKRFYSPHWLNAVWEAISDEGVVRFPDGVKDVSIEYLAPFMPIHHGGYVCGGNPIIGYEVPQSELENFDFFVNNRGRLGTISLCHKIGEGSKFCGKLVAITAAHNIEGRDDDGTWYKNNVFYTWYGGYCFIGSTDTVLVRAPIWAPLSMKLININLVDDVAVLEIEPHVSDVFVDFVRHIGRISVHPNDVGEEVVLEAYDRLIGEGFVSGLVSSEVIRGFSYDTPHLAFRGIPNLYKRGDSGTSIVAVPDSQEDKPTMVSLLRGETRLAYASGRAAADIGPSIELIHKALEYDNRSKLIVSGEWRKNTYVKPGVSSPKVIGIPENLVPEQPENWTQMQIKPKGTVKVRGIPEHLVPPKI